MKITCVLRGEFVEDNLSQFRKEYRSGVLRNDFELALKRIPISDIDNYRAALWKFRRAAGEAEVTQN